MTFQLGDVVPLSVTVTDADGNLADATAVTLTVTLPDATTVVTGPIASTTPGVYNHDYVTVQAGAHAVRWVATGTNASAYDDAFTVEATDNGAFISLHEQKVHQKKDLIKTSDDAELVGFIAASCEKIVELIGPVAPTTCVDTTPRRWCRGPIVLDQHPVISITSVAVVGGDAIVAADLDNDVQGWELDPGPGLLSHSSWWPAGRIRVTYRAGRTPVPAKARLAALELTAHLWRTIKLNGTGGRPPVAGGDDIVIAGAAYALPNRVRELLGLGKNPTADVMVG